MTEHEQNLRDLAAMFAMSGLLMRGGSYADSVGAAFEVADLFMEMRDNKESQPEGIASIMSKRKYERKPKT
jgi:hypothetical protein